MIKINLLPWREERKLLAINRYIALLIIVGILSIIIVYIAHVIIISSTQVYTSYDRDKLKSNISIITNKINKMKTYEVQYQELNKFTGVIDEMQISPVILLEALKEVPKLIPDSVKVRTAVFKGQVYIFNGQAISQGETFKFMENLKTLKFVKDVELQDFNKSFNSIANFTIKVFITYKNNL